MQGSHFGGQVQNRTAGEARLHTVNICQACSAPADLVQPPQEA